MNTLSRISNKIVAPASLSGLLKDWNNEQTVFTNGCFDILHAAHIQLLSFCKDQGDKLIVGLNSDASVKRLKGENRPINKEGQRALLLASLEMVDAIIVFEQDTPLELIQQIKPAVLVKGGDYTEANIVGAEAVKAAGGKVLVFPYIAGLSTTEIILKMKS